MSSGERVVNARNPRNVGAPPGRRAQDTGTSCRTALWVSVAVTARRHRVSLMKLPWPSAVSMLINLPVPGGCFNVPLRLSRSSSRVRRLFGAERPPALESSQAWSNLFPPRLPGTHVHSAPEGSSRRPPSLGQIKMSTLVPPGWRWGVRGRPT